MRLSITVGLAAVRANPRSAPSTVSGSAAGAETFVMRISRSSSARVAARWPVIAPEIRASTSRSLAVSSLNRRWMFWWSARTSCANASSRLQWSRIASAVLWRSRAATSSGASPWFSMQNQVCSQFGAPPHHTAPRVCEAGSAS